MFNSSSYSKALQDLVAHPDANVLLVFGDQDEFTSVSSYRQWANELKGPRAHVVEVANASHFWRGESASEMEAAIVDWLP